MAKPKSASSFSIARDFASNPSESAASDHSCYDFKPFGTERSRSPKRSADSAVASSINPDLERAFAPLPELGPLFIELCAGSAVLSSEAARRGYLIMPVGCARNRRRTCCRVTTLDLSSESSSQHIRKCTSNVCSK